MNRDDTSTPTPDWWGTHEGLEDDHHYAWTLGPVKLWIRPDTHEYRTAVVPSVDSTLRDWSREDDATTAPEGANVARFAFDAGRRPLRMAPALADRHIVTRPDHAFTVLAASSARIFVSSPLWIALYHGDDATPMLEVPTLQLSNTWFGGPTRPNGLAYALRTRARLELDDDVWHPFRVLTPIVIYNHARSHLPVERVRLPMRELSLFHGARGFWTQTVKIIRREHEADQVDLEFDETPPADVAKGRCVAPPRDEFDRSRLRRALDALLS